MRYCSPERLAFDREVEEVIIPMIAFIEGGMTIPMGRITRDYLRNHRLCPQQCARNFFRIVRDCALGPLFYRMLGQIHVNGWSRVVASQNGGSTDYIFPFRLRVLQWSSHLFNYWKNKKTIIEKEFLILLI